MRTAEWLQILFASLFAGAAWTSSLTLRRRLWVSLLAVIVAFCVIGVRLIARSVPPLFASVLRDWLPGALFLLPYWQTGQFFTGPHTDVQNKLTEFDRRLMHGLRLESAKPLGKGVAALLEIAYVTVYPLVPVGLGILYVAGMRPHADHYWTVVLLATYTCYVITPFVQALPPRLLPRSEGAPQVPTTSPRRLNAWIVHHASIGAITFPSAHVASAVAASLVLLQLVPLAGITYACITVAIAFACIFGGYHYAADVLAGAVVAVLAFVTTYTIVGT
jgi:membrane-associated phospholipid phosphatase